MDNLLGMGYSETWRIKVLTSALKGYKKVLDLVNKGLTNRNRLGAKTATFRRWKKLMGPSTWFQDKQAKDSKNGGRSQTGRSKGDARETEGVMFVPATPQGQLKTRMQELDLKLGLRGRMKYVETTGETIQGLLFKTDPWGTPCRRENCMTC